MKDFSWPVFFLSGFAHILGTLVLLYSAFQIPELLFKALLWVWCTLPAIIAVTVGLNIEKAGAEILIFPLWSLAIAFLLGYFVPKCRDKIWTKNSFPLGVDEWFWLVCPSVSWAVREVIFFAPNKRILGKFHISSFCLSLPDFYKYQETQLPWFPWRRNNPRLRMHFPIPQGNFKPSDRLYILHRDQISSVLPF